MAMADEKKDGNVVAKGEETPPCPVNPDELLNAIREARKRTRVVLRKMEEGQRITPEVLNLLVGI